MELVELDRQEDCCLEDLAVEDIEQEISAGNRFLQKRKTSLPKDNGDKISFNQSSFRVITK